MMKRNTTILSLLAVFALLATAAFADDYKIDGAHSKASFKVRHMMISNVEGRFGDMSGMIQFDPNDPSKCSVNVSIKTASISTDNPDRDTHLKSDAFFDVAKYPEITFKSKRVEKRGNQWVAIGDFTMKDVTKEIEIPFELNTLKTARGTVIGATATLKINRMDYHVAWNRAIEGGGAVVGDEVTVDLSVEARTPPPAAAAK